MAKENVFVLDTGALEAVIYVKGIQRQSNNKKSQAPARL